MRYEFKRWTHECLPKLSTSSVLITLQNYHYSLGGHSEELSFPKWDAPNRKQVIGAHWKGNIFPSFVRSLTSACIERINFSICNSQTNRNWSIAICANAENTHFEIRSTNFSQPFSRRKLPQWKLYARFVDQRARWRSHPIAYKIKYRH